MAELSDVIAYLCIRYPHKYELSKTRLTKMVYLADWRSAITEGEQLTNIRWIFNHYGPYVDDVWREAQSNGGFRVTSDTNMFGDPKEVVAYVGSNEPNLTEREKDVLDHVIAKTQSLSWKDFIRLVYSTYPVLSRGRYDDLPLTEIAEEYKAQVATISGN